MAKKQKLQAKVLSQRILAEGIYDMWLETPLAKDVCPGQFVGVFPTNKSTLLPRPISICEVNEERTAIRLVYRVVGSGTAEFTFYQPGDYIMILGILGNGFPVKEAAGKKAVVMGGGIGVPPLLETAKSLSSLEEKAATVSAVMGYRNKETFLSDEFEKCSNLYIATEDGSIGTKGNVIDAMNEMNIDCDVIFACGPMPMLKAIKTYAAAKGIKAYISLEERMACGVGACLGCVCKTKNVDDHSHVKNARICTDGPVFDADDIDI
ncbi:dihydroorotate dehydrogenase electron transfer subunit [Butyrivibrio sp. YAB3001]|uniref:dihydroorotate dehydrogenase electron transfer subunit n=1 Tax=Butyrivibrio sp. YAB3001 TaxID=1520812 RepID=UPI0008F669D0|nr:dihydroorotate dehydrogenase electron transfer subunit [Butyrivibrio sp. YAB3001]SFC09012.1 dihydroorotate dehydrogenase electron transfer subunit [Butyrivibrio sp. YAB3001]